MSPPAARGTPDPAPGPDERSPREIAEAVRRHLRAAGPVAAAQHLARAVRTATDSWRRTPEAAGDWREAMRAALDAESGRALLEPAVWRDEAPEAVLGVLPRVRTAQELWTLLGHDSDLLRAYALVTHGARVARHGAAMAPLPAGVPTLQALDPGRLAVMVAGDSARPVAVAALANVGRAVLDVPALLDAVEAWRPRRLVRRAGRPLGMAWVLLLSRGARGRVPGLGPELSDADAYRSLTMRPDYTVPEVERLLGLFGTSAVTVLRHPDLRYGPLAAHLATRRRPPDVARVLLGQLRADPAVPRATVARRLALALRHHGAALLGGGGRLNGVLGDAAVVRHLDRRTRAVLLEQLDRARRLALLGALAAGGDGPSSTPRAADVGG